MIQSNKLRKNIAGYRYLLILITLHLLLLINIKFTAWPEMLAWPYLMIKGWLPYRDIAIAHNPLLLVDLAIFNRIFDVGLLQLKIYTWIWILLTDTVLFFVVKKLWNFKYALNALAFYIPMQIIYDGNALWFDLALAPLALLIYYSLKKRDYLWAGIFFGLAFFIKQTSFWFAFPIALYFFKDLKKRELEGILSLTKGFLVVAVIVMAALAILGILPDYYEWAVKFGVLYLPHAAGQVAFPTVKQFLVAVFPFSIFFPLFFQEKGKHRDLIVWALFSGLGVYPRFELFHFQPALPFLAIIASIVGIAIFQKKEKLLKIGLLGYLIICLLIIGKYFYRNWGKETRFYGQNEMNVAAFVKSAVEPGDKIYVLNYWDSVYAMTNTLPATRPLVPFLPWYLKYDDLENGILSNILTDFPKLIVKGDYTENGLGSYRIDELDEILDRYYTLSYGVSGVQVYQINR